MPPTPPIKARTAIVTGAGRGIGRAIAARLAASGANVAVVSRTLDQLNETTQLIARSGGQALAVVADLTKLDDVARLVDQTQSAFGDVDILVNCAGFAAVATIENMEPAVFDTLVATNTRAIFLCCREVWPIMAKTGSGAIVNISSVAAYDPFPGLGAYGATKAFVNAYTKALADEGKPLGIRVYGVAPGAVETDMLRGSFPDFPADQTLQPDEVAALVEMLLSPACTHVSGQTLVIKKS
ncbi:MAG TPA: SDR family oxidoreductase [Phycisphaerae bacterium]|nr:SDR family oxidoreductase [Phycisphaerae bacterium]